MDGLLVWYLVCAIGFAWFVHAPVKKKEPNRVKEWLAQLVASSDPLEDFLYDQDTPQKIERHETDRR